MSNKPAVSNQRSALSSQRGIQYSILTAHGSREARGFTLIETLVAVSVLLVSLAGPLSIAAQALQSAYYARDQITAFYLAQEAMEYVHAVRDQNYIAGTPWLNGLSSCIDASCAVDFPNFTHEACSGACPFVLIGASSNLFNLASGDTTIYRRTLEINTLPETSDEVRVTVRVEWKTSRLDRSFEIHEQLFDWL